MILDRRTTLIPKLSDMPLQRRLTLELLGRLKNSRLKNSSLIRILRLLSS